MESFTLKAVLRLTGLNPDTVRAWEKRYQAVKPQRTESGRRMYSEIEVNRLKLLAELTYSGHSISTIANLPDEKLVTLLASIKTSNVLSKSNAINPQIKNITDELIHAVSAFDLAKLEIQLAKANFSMSSRDLLFYLIPQLMYQVGSKIIDGTMSIAQEHALSELIKKNIRKIYDDLEPVNGSSKSKKILLFATPENHMHEFGVLMSAVLCRFNGFVTHFLGANLPSESLITAAKSIGPHAIVLGLSPSSTSELKNKSIQYLMDLEKNLDSSLMLWLGGSIPKLQKENFKQEIWTFESMEELEKKLQNHYQ